tara:strand:- start:2988 stop:4361 length:1374 start_codon:yes stop_codon:yes gene_type:complete
MKVNSEIFRAYDIRGIFERELSQDLIYKIGQAVGSQVLDENSKQIYVGRDGRISGKEVSDRFIEGILATGCDVIFIGLVHTPLLYFATFEGVTKNGVMITGSHNPKEYNGFKIVINNSSLKEDDIQNLKLKIEQSDFKVGSGKLSKESFNETYVKKISTKINIKNKLKIVLDCGNGSGGVLGPEILRNYSSELIELFCEVDGNFPNHHPDPSEPKNLSKLIETVKKENADLGIAFDGDGDRLGVIDSEGEMIFPDRYLALMAEDILRKNESGKIVFDVKCSKQLERIIKRNNGIPIMTKTGHSFIKSEIARTDAILGGEMSGHIFYNDNWYGFDDGIFASLRLLEILSTQNISTHEVFKKIPKMFSTPEIKISINDAEKFRVVEELKNNFKPEGYNSILLDGLRLEEEDSWGLIRASNTTPALVLRFEANTEKKLMQIKELFQNALLKIDDKLNFIN